MRQKPATMNISLPTALRTQLEKKLASHAYSSASEYVRDLIRRDLQRDAIAQVDELLLDGLRSGPAVRVTADWWKERRTALAAHRRGRTKKSKRS